MIPPRKIGIFGGSFDPPHNGHVFCAKSAAKILGLEKILIIPAAIQPLKPAGASASDEDRLNMVRETFGNEDIFQIDTREIDRGGASYTIDTLRELKEIYPDSLAQMYLILGADALADVVNWKEPAEIFRLVSVVSIRRTGAASVKLPDDWRVKIIPLDTPLLDISSSQIRELVSNGRPFESLVPAGVSKIIKARTLYQT